MKRFYKEATADQTPEGWRILLDGKQVLTPGRGALLLPTKSLAEAIAAEWRAQQDKIIPASMPLLRLANTVLDGVAKSRDEVAAAILRFGAHDLLCYRAEDEKLAARQKAQWDPVLDWAASRFDARLCVTTGVSHIAQPPEALVRLGEAVSAYDDFALASLHVLASITGSLVAGLAVAEGELTAGKAFALSRLDESHQAEKWGEDEEAALRSRALAREMDAAAAFLAAARD